jgi:hypothetical protein
MNNAIVEIFEGQQITIRPSDSYWNATEMCDRYGRAFADFARLKGSKAYLVVASENMGIPMFSLVESSPGRGSQTWVHPRIALKLAAWLNPAFEFWVYSVIERLLTQGKIELQYAYDSLLDALDVSEGQVRELLARSERLTLDLSQLGDEYAIDDNARTSEAAAWARVEQLEKFIRDNGLEPPQP